MKRIFICLSLGLLFSAGAGVSAQVFDLSTGIVNGSNPPALQPLLSYDDTWTIMEPGSPTFQPVPCGSGDLDGYGYSYTGHSYGVRWLSPYLSPIGEHTSLAPQGYYYYKMNFTLPNFCSKPADAQAIMDLRHIGGDNLIDQIIVNGNVYPVSFAFGPTWGPGWLNVIADIVPGLNEIQVRLNNYGSFMGIEIEGDLTINNMIYQDASFCVSVNGTSVTATPNSMPGYHVWDVYSSATGNPGSYTYLGSYNTPTLNVNIPGSGPCYFIRHKYEGECGYDCSAQTVCSVPCEGPPHGQCDLTPPTNLHFDASSNKFYWDPVPGAVSYIIEFFPWDASCCRGTSTGEVMIYYPPLSIPVGGTSYTLNPGDFGTRFVPWCFGWRVRAVCENGATTVSEKKCAQLGDIKWGDKSATLGTAATDPNRASVDVFPNPTQDMVDLVLQTGKDVSFTIFVYDIGGRLVKTVGEQNTVGNRAVVRMDAQSLGAGVYMIMVTTSDKQTITKKLVVE